MKIFQETDEFDQDGEAIEMTQEEFDERKAMCEDLLVKAKAASKLAEDLNFKMIVMDEYFTKEPHRLGSLMASGKLTKQGFDGAVEDLRSIGHLRTFLTEFIQKGNIAQDELVQLELARQASIQATPSI